MCTLLPVEENGKRIGAALKVEDISQIKKIIAERDQAIRELEDAQNKLLSEKTLNKAFPKFIGTSQQIEHVKRLALKASKTNSNVLILGESGTGKSILAKAIHENSRYKDKPFVHVNCGSIPATLLESELFGYEEGAFTGARRGGKKGLFELAHNGTIFLDEIGELPLKLQARLLRVLQEKAVIPIGGDTVIPINVRIIAATHRNLEESVNNGTFRQDLYYRLNVLRLSLPPLRERKDDIPLLIDRLLEKICNKTAKKRPIITDDALRMFYSYHWPGNVRELQNILERLVVLKAGCKVYAEDICEMIKIPKDKIENTETPSGTLIELKGSLDDMEKAIICKTLELTGYDKERTCKKLGISQTTLWRRLKKWNIAD